ncbi:MAG: Spy/CpxP family protein refolding chaperone [Sulfurimonas sp.]|uniref:Spy/CpxP family protein refolding chaperone n=1 Tax=Sulfurimonas sp. TaxID=2022749 RepID=UPI0025E76A02|nr:Spy/CpxP family protein refolding chaperone [Sulfurimonas sp.]MCK9491381.1 Spy/CpxP family protein refolding chaperone [Sulfurimonas sp.]
MIKLKIFVLLCSLFLSLSLFADDDYEHKKNHIYKNLDYLNLNEHQHKEMKEILIDYRKKYEKFYKKKDKREKKLQELIKEEKFDKKEYKNIIKEINEKAVELEIDTLKEIHSILSASQRKKFSYYLQEWRVE